MSWQARIEHTPTGLALTFGAPLSRLDMAPDVAQHLASLLAVEARHRLAGVVRTLEAENACTSPVRMLPQLETSETVFNTDRAENSQFYVEQTTPQPNLAFSPSSRNKAENGSKSVVPMRHPLCCDCSPCLNGDEA